MNAQHSIATTPKYNFPLSKESLQPPYQFIKLSMRSLNQHTFHQLLGVEKPATQLFPSPRIKSPTPRARLVPLKPDPTETPIVAMDVSSIRLGETAKGALLAVRGAIAWKNARHYQYLRLGPFPFHITNETENEICRQLHRNPQRSHTYPNVSPNIPNIQQRLTTLLERWIQASISQTAHGSLILLDGNLAAGPNITSAKALKHLLSEAQHNRNTILAFTKTTRLHLSGHPITDLILKHTPPCLLRIEALPSSMGPLQLMGNVYAAKLAAGNYAFRLDIDKHLSDTEAVDAVQKLVGNDLVTQSYPETLRLAHIFSTFTATEVLAMQRCITQDTNLKIVSRPNVRRMLFGRYGKGPDG